MFLSWYLDEIVVFWFRTMLRLINERRSRTWPNTQGKVSSDTQVLGFYPWAEIVYGYTVERESYTGVHKRAFFFKSSAKDYAGQFVAATA